MKSSFHFMYIQLTSLCETQTQRNIKSKIQHRLFPTQKVVKTQQNHKIPPDSLSEGAFVTISHFDIHKSHYVVIRREPLKTHYSVMCYVQPRLLQISQRIDIFIHPQLNHAHTSYSLLLFIERRTQPKITNCILLKIKEQRAETRTVVDLM